MSGKNCVTKDFLSQQNKGKKKKKQKLQDGGVSFDYGTLSNKEKTYYDSLNSAQKDIFETQYIDKNLSSDPKGEKGRVEASSYGQNDVTDELGDAVSGAGTAGWITAIIQGVDTATQGMRDEETGVYENDISAVLGDMVNPGEGTLRNYEQVKSGDSHWISMFADPMLQSVLSNRNQREIEKEETRNQLMAAGEKASIGKGSFKDGGVKTDEPKKKTVKVPIGRDPKTGETIYSYREDESWQTAQFTPRDWRVQTPTNTKQIAQDVYGMTAEEFKKGYKENPEEFLNKLVKLQVQENEQAGFKADDKYRVGKDSAGRWTLERGIINSNKTQQLENTPNFVKRMSDPNAPYIQNEDGTRSSHLMEWGENDGKYQAYPTLVQQGDKLVTPDDPWAYAKENNNYLEFDTKREAKKYAKGSWKKEQGLSEGGEVEGKGTSKSDSIDASIPRGSFIVPADANENAVNRIKEYMNYNEASGIRKGSNDANVSLSDGELYIPPEDVEEVNDFAKFMGYKNGLNSLAPKAKHKLVEDGEYASGLDDYMGTMGGAAQIITGLVQAGNLKEPESNVPGMLHSLAAEVSARATYGMNPYERTQAENFITSSMANERDIIANVSGGSASQTMGNLAASTIRANKAKLALEVESSKMKEEKQQYADSVYMAAIQAEENIFDKEYDKYIRNEESINELVGSGISNIVGQSQFNKYNESLERSNMSAKQIAEIEATEKLKKDTRRGDAKDWISNIFTKDEYGVHTYTANPIQHWMNPEESLTDKIRMDEMNIY